MEMALYVSLKACVKVKGRIALQDYSQRAKTAELTAFR